METSAGRDAARLLARRILRGFSVEFHVQAEGYTGGVREIRKARLAGVGLVDRPGHRNSRASLRALSNSCARSEVVRPARFFL